MLRFLVLKVKQLGDLEKDVEDFIMEQSKKVRLILEQKYILLFVCYSMIMAYVSWFIGVYTACIDNQCYLFFFNV